MRHGSECLKAKRSRREAGLARDLPEQLRESVVAVDIWEKDLMGEKVYFGTRVEI